MTAAVETEKKSNSKDVVIVREFSAPRDLVWAAWTETEHIEKWFGPKGFTTRVISNDWHVGGTNEYVMVGPDGTEYPGKGVIIEIDPKNKIVSTDEFGEDFIESNPGMDLPTGMTTTAVFDDLGDRCRLTLTISHPTVEDRIKHEKIGVVDGWGSSFDKLDEYLAQIRN